MIKEFGIFRATKSRGIYIYIYIFGVKTQCIIIIYYDLDAHIYPSIIITISHTYTYYIYIYMFFAPKNFLFIEINFSMSDRLVSHGGSIISQPLNTSFVFFF